MPYPLGQKGTYIHLRSAPSRYLKKSIKQRPFSLERSLFSIHVAFLSTWFRGIDWERHLDCKSRLFPKLAARLACADGDDQLPHLYVLHTIHSVLFPSHKEVREIGWPCCVRCYGVEHCTYRR